MNWLTIKQIIEASKTNDKAICLWCNGEGETEESLGMHSDYFSCKHCKGTGMETINDKKKESK